MGDPILDGVRFESWKRTTSLLASPSNSGVTLTRLILGEVCSHPPMAIIRRMNVAELGTDISNTETAADKNLSRSASRDIAGATAGHDTHRARSGQIRWTPLHPLGLLVEARPYFDKSLLSALSVEGTT
jgi:hypothetical protein